MPLILGHWKMDNFFERPRYQKMPNRLHDCYFYYYSTCVKGKNCEFRHEPIALGHETMCPKWIDGLCYDNKCKNRHMFIKKNRSRIQCYFETQATGCTKAHCVFKHKRDDSDTGDNKCNQVDLSESGVVEDASVGEQDVSVDDTSK
ncbi:zinc finger CCCH domain-containing protein 11B-like [Bradysia coprophila]|uniref:zinc finger CCCH domain-containing protein 11B-like n=1 Tax=Bradysia coprophila TaxID=38358 RepID=UPI00187D9FF8|nr:zinc finger CCCH domain-containing protein 11B-like [Bradysia coprophila]